MLRGRAQVVARPRASILGASVHEAATAAEREEIWAFRHSVYVEEMGRKYGRDAEGRVHDPEDELPSTYQLYTRDDEGVSGVLRVRAWAPGAIPPHDVAALSLERFVGIERLATCELERLMVRPTRRGSLVLVALVSAAYELAVDRLGVDLAFASCVPALVHLYRRIGMRPYDGRLVALADGVSVPLVLAPSDLATLERVNSFLLPLAAARFGPGGREPLDLAPFVHLLEADRTPISLDPDATAAVLLQSQRAQSRSGFLEDLSQTTLELLAQEGLLLSISAGSLVVEKDLSQRELYVIIDGVFEVLNGDRRLKLLSDGDVFGEIAFFSTVGRRTASVRAVSDGRAVVLRRRYVDQLRRSDPAAAAELLFSLARVQADRAASLRL